jgi:hypothetical protein
MRMALMASSVSVIVLLLRVLTYPHTWIDTAAVVVVVEDCCCDVQVQVIYSRPI